MRVTPQIVEELKRIQKRDGLLLRARVVREAKNRKNPLHGAGFTWNIKRAAEEHWLDQAGELIREVVVYVDHNEDEIPSRIFVSLSQDRSRGGGYRGMIEVMSNPGMRRMLLDDALADLQRFEQRYGRLKEFAELFRVSKAIRKQLAEKAA